MKTSSAKAKGRRLQQMVRDTLRNLFKNDLEPEDIESRQMGGAGVDVVLSPAAKKLINFDFECKNQEKLNLNEALKQAEENSKGGLGRIPVVVFTKNHSKTYIALEFNTFISLAFPEQKKQLLINNNTTVGTVQSEHSIS